MQPEISNMLTQTIIPAVSTILLAALSWATGEAISWIKERTKGARAERLTELMGHLDKAIEATVMTAQETVVKGLKNDGKFTPEEAAAIKQAVMGSVAKQAAPIIDELSKMGIAEVNEILHNRVEKAVILEKAMTGTDKK